MASRCSTVVTFSDTQESADGHSKFALAGEAVPLPRPSLLRPVAEPGARPAKKREPAPSATRQATRVLPDRGKRLTEDGPSPSQSLTHNAWHRGMEVEFPASAGVDGDERKRRRVLSSAAMAPPTGVVAQRLPCCVIARSALIMPGRHTPSTVSVTIQPRGFNSAPNLLIVSTPRGSSLALRRVRLERSSAQLARLTLPYPQSRPPAWRGTIHLRSPRPLVRPDTRWHPCCYP